jgi:uncharacterized membrane protein
MQTRTTRRTSPGENPAQGYKGESGTAPSGGRQVRKSITIGRPRAELYGFWRDLSHLAQFMTHVKSVELLDEERSHWRVEGPAGREVEWDAVIIEDRPDALIRWRSTEEAEVDNGGAVFFEEAPAGRGTVVTVTLSYNPPAGKLGGWIASLFGEEPAQQVSQDLFRFKALMETGEIPTSGDLRAVAEEAYAAPRRAL